MQASSRRAAAREVAEAFNEVVTLQERQNLEVRKISRVLEGVPPDLAKVIAGLTENGEMTVLVTTLDALIDAYGELTKRFID